MDLSTLPQKGSAESTLEFTLTKSGLLKERHTGWLGRFLTETLGGRQAVTAEVLKDLTLDRLTQLSESLQQDSKKAKAFLSHLETNPSKAKALASRLDVGPLSAEERIKAQKIMQLFSDALSHHSESISAPEQPPSNSFASQLAVRVQSNLEHLEMEELVDKLNQQSNTNLLEQAKDKAHAFLKKTTHQEEPIPLDTFPNENEKEKAIKGTLERRKFQIPSQPNLGTHLTAFREELKKKVKENYPTLTTEAVDKKVQEMLLGLAIDSSLHPIDELLSMLLINAGSAFSAGEPTNLTSIRPIRLYQDGEKLVVENTTVRQHPDYPDTCFVATRKSTLSVGEDGTPQVVATLTWERISSEQLLRREYETAKRTGAGREEVNAIKRRCIHNQLERILEPAESPSTERPEGLQESVTKNLTLVDLAPCNSPEELKRAVEEQVLTTFPECTQEEFVGKTQAILESFARAQQELTQALSLHSGEQSPRPIQLVPTKEGLAIESRRVVHVDERSFVAKRRVVIGATGNPQVETTVSEMDTIELLMKEYLESQRDGVSSKERQLVQERVKKELFPRLLERAERRTEEREQPLSDSVEEEIDRLQKKFLASDLTPEERQHGRELLTKLQSFQEEWKKPTHPILGMEGVDEATQRLQTASTRLAELRQAHELHSKQGEHVTLLEEAIQKQEEIHAHRTALHKKCEQDLRNLILQVKSSKSLLREDKKALSQLQRYLDPSQEPMEFDETFSSIVQSLSLKGLPEFRALQGDIIALTKATQEEKKAAVAVILRSETLQQDGVEVAALRTCLTELSQAKVTLRRAEEAREESIFKTFGRQLKEIRPLQREAQEYRGAGSPTDISFVRFRNEIEAMVGRTIPDQRNAKEVSEKLLLGTCIDAFPHMKHPKDMMDTLVGPLMASGETVFMPSMIAGTETIPLSLRETAEGVEAINRTLYHLNNPTPGAPGNTSTYCLTIRSSIDKEGQQKSEISWKKVH